MKLLTNPSMLITQIHIKITKEIKECNKLRQLQLKK